MNENKPDSGYRISLRSYYETDVAKRFKWIKKDKPSIARHKKIITRCRDADGLVLDVGCGFREILSAIKSEKNEAIGADISYATFKAGIASIDHAVVCDAESLPFRSASINLVLCIDALEHLTNPVRGVTEINRVLKRGGKAIFSVPNSEAPHYVAAKVHMHPFTVNTFKKIISENAFSILSFEVFRVKYFILGLKYWETLIIESLKS